ncbi:HTH-type transcriptional regulator PuuR [Ruegeria sp. THAF57]|uniref:helix-turn-helix domain-containing protein n=1 Tax=Ruegeria sp. THAF57 TaxID=2744555 RepID=UPI0015DE4E02|nr:cupin domain-containing protein [Ruegeria sp. THAF57]CAD0186818.1 HTH-type transcriptional regulator PuuR [Ruegeria sp. THAF57]
MQKQTKKQATSQSVHPANKADDVEKIVSRVGQKLLALRSEQGMSLQKLSSKSDVSGPAIHKIERSDMVPTITTLLKLSNALGVSVNYFIEDGDDLPEPVLHTKGDDRSIVFTPHKGLNLEGITGPYQQFRAAAAVAVMKPDANSGRKLLRHSGEELVYVLSGEVEFQVGNTEYHLKTGDSLHFSGEIPHKWKNISEDEAELIWVALRGE